MSVPGLSDTGLESIERVLDYLTNRQRALAANVANATTPGYRTVDVRADFDSMLSEEIAELRLVRTSDRHFEVVGPEAEMAFQEVEGLPSRPDGNNVQLDREMLAMSLNRLRYQMGLAWASQRLRAVRRAVQEGAGG
jgi:flagellar basal-body rod protein FlgB